LIVLNRWADAIPADIERNLAQLAIEKPGRLAPRQLVRECDGCNADDAK
jgi:hypothetical protein